MNQSIEQELKEHIFESLESYTHLEFNGEDQAVDHLITEIFNVDYYIIGYYQSEEWLKKHNVSIFEAIGFVNDQNEHQLGELENYDNAECLVNRLVYWVGAELMWSLQTEIYESWKTLKKEYDTAGKNS